MLIRPSTPADLGSITDIYGWNVKNGTGTFEMEPPTLDDMTARRAAVETNGWPWLVAEVDGAVLGYAYANQFRPRMAYRFMLEDSIYLAPQAQGRGIGKALLVDLLARCESRGARQMLAVIGDADNAGSIGLHRSCGFGPAGVLTAAGWKFERWLDVVIMQKSLGAGSTIDAIELK